MNLFVVFCLHFVLVDVCTGMSEPNGHAPKLVDLKGQRVRSYRATVAEGSRQLLFSPPIRAVDEDIEGGARFICGFRLYGKGSGAFVVQHQDVSRTARVLVRKNAQMNFERRHKYKLQLAAFDCGGPELESKRVPVHVEVTDVNEFAPEFEQDSYLFEVDSGKLLPHIAQLSATDADGSSDYGRVCKYELLSSDEPFAINKKGILRSTRALNYELKHNHILEVTAEDCAGLKSAPVLVTITVRRPALPQTPEPPPSSPTSPTTSTVSSTPPTTTTSEATNPPTHPPTQRIASKNSQPTAVCTPHWEGISDRESSVAVPLVLFSGAELRTCDIDCEIEKFSVKVNMEKEKGEDTCKRYPAAPAAVCGTGNTVQELLGQDQSWTRRLEGFVEGVYRLDGLTDAVTVPESTAHRVGDQFSVLFWLRHRGDAPNIKQHVLCYSDAEGMNRHHYSVFLHNSHLVLLLRREPDQEDNLDIFRPAELRWQIPEISDGEWHHYAIVADFPNVTLLVDGHEFVSTKDNPDVADDWPLHPTKRVKSQKLTVGACWQGVEKEYVQHLNGEVAGLLLVHEAPAAVKRRLRCIHSCSPKLELESFADLQSGMTISYNTKQSEMTIGGLTFSGVQQVLRELVYITKHPALATVRMRTELKCLTGDVSIPQVQLKVTPAAVAAPAPTQPNVPPPIPEVAVGPVQVKLGASPNHVEDEQEMKEGVRLFPDLNIVVEGGGSPLDAARPELLIDRCSLRGLDGALDGSHDGISLPNRLKQSLNLNAAWGERHEYVIEGPAEPYLFEDFLRQVMYYHRTPQKVASLAFTLTCTSNTDQSDPLRVELSVIHDNMEPAALPHVAHAQVNAAERQSLVYSELTGVHSARDGGSAGAGTVLLIVFGAAFLLLLVGVAVYKLRATRRGGRQQLTVEAHQELEWDGEGVTITVNPQAEMDEAGVELADSDTDSCYREDGELASSDEDEPRKDMEWDNSAMDF